MTEFTKQQRETLDEIVRKAQSEMSDEGKRYLDISRIPLICYSIVEIGKKLTDIQASINKTDDDKENRIRSLEKNMWKLVGIGIIVAPVVSTIVTIFITKTIK